MAVTVSRKHDLALFERLNVRFIRRHVAKTIKRDERGFYYSNADSPPARFYFKTWRRRRGLSGDWVTERKGLHVVPCGRG